MQDFGKIINFMVLVHTYHMMEPFIKEVFKTVRYMEKVCLFFQIQQCKIYDLFYL